MTSGPKGGGKKISAQSKSAATSVISAVSALVRRNRKHLSAIAAVLAAAFLIFYAGVTVGFLRLSPSIPIRDSIAAIRDVAKNGRAYFLDKPTMHIRKLRYDSVGVTRTAPLRAEPGVTFMTGLFGNVLGARLYDINGALLHEWPVNFFKVAPDQMAYPFDALIHGGVLYPNGDIVVNLDGRGMMRVSACGDIIWRNSGRSHHSLHIDDDGTLWAPTGAVPYNEPRLAGGQIRFDRLAQFDPQTGEKLLEIDIVKSIVEADAQGLVLINKIVGSDAMHLNDVEILSAQMADQFPGFNAGDIMLSSRHFNQLWILDGGSHALKWWIVGLTIGQHDPDFQPDGTITVFDNRGIGLPRPENNYRGAGGGSRILKIDPRTKDYETIYASSEKNNFYSVYRGKHQVLDNGNILIAETDAGRVFEATPDGDIVWEFINAWDDDEVGWVMGATRYPESYGSFSETTCPESQD